MGTIGEAGGQMTNNLTVGEIVAENGERNLEEQRQSLRTKIASYEAREDEFLTEIEGMRTECGEGTATSSNDEGQKSRDGGEATSEAPTMLDTLCTLIGEIGKLRRENRRLRRRFEVQQTEENQTQPKNARGVSSLPRPLLLNAPRGSSAFSCFPLQSSSASCSSAVSSLFSGSDRPPLCKMFGRPTSQTQQTERLSSPPPMPKKSIGSLLTVSAYSADLSSDASLNKQRILGESLHKNSNSNFGGDGNGGGQSEPFGWDAEGGGRNEAPKGLKPRRGMARRAEMQKPPKTGEQGKQLLCLSASVTSGTSPAGSSSSACSSVEPTLACRPQNDANRSSADVPMSVSRCSSILDIFGIRRRKPSPSSNSSAEGSGRVIGTFSNMMDSLITRRTAGTSGPNRKFGMFVSRGNRRHSQQLQYLGDEPSPPYSPAASPILVDGYSSGEMAKMGTKLKMGQRQKLGDGRMESEPNLLKNWHKSNESVLAGEEIGPNKQRKGRPRSCFLGPPQSDWTTNERREVTESGKKAETKERTSSLEQELCLEMQLLRARNARLIGQLREKSGQLSMAEARADKLGRELDQMRAQKRLDASLGANCVRMAKSVEKVISELKDQLSNSFRGQLQSLRLEAQRHQQIALNASRCDRQSLRASMAEVERLQHENCALLQKQANARPRDADGRTQLHDLLSSYDALYAFAAGIVRKLGQMRERVAEKDAELFNLELEALQSQSQALLAQTNCEWLRVKCPLLLMANASDRRLSRRPKSFHGQTLAEQMTDFGHLQQQMNLPFKLIAQRIRQHRDKKGPKWAESEDVTNRFDVLMEENEQNIELEFLRLFKSARALARISGTNGELTDKGKTEGNLVPPFCVDFSFPSQIAETLRPQQRQANQSDFLIFAHFMRRISP
ncbi:hypothetical protein niasHS_003698 [Heterodera schachtii]|uniref:Uncharacterized protein n=1 Tax=Heterodera schachtii TaxID=97005 RepID=A0ABD2KHQ1_HETSC